MENEKTKNDVYFGENGLTSTSANHVCNCAKEYYEGILEELGSASFYDTAIQLIDSTQQNVTHIGWNEEHMEDVDNKLHTVIAMKDLIAWLREAIKARQNKIDSIRCMRTEEYAIKFGIEMPKRPTMEDTLTEADVLAKMSVKDRHNMLRLEATAATYGQYIHPNGNFSRARADLSKKINNPTSTSGSGRDTIITTYKQTVKLEKVDELFFQLQQSQRSAQAELNRYKHQIDSEVRQDAIEKERKYEAEVREYDQAYNALAVKCQLWKKEEMARVEKLGIIIPDRLRDTYNMVNALGKKKDK